MIKYFISTIILFVFSYYLSAQPSDYYTTATGTGYVLKSQLHDIIDGHSEQSYASLWTHFQTTDVDNYYENDGSPLDMYSENPNGIDSYNFNWGSDQCGSYSGEGSCYNREHSFPKSWFNDASPMYSDLFHLVLSDGYVNGQRGNYPFGEVGSADWTSQNGSKKAIVPIRAIQELYLNLSMNLKAILHAFTFTWQPATKMFCIRGAARCSMVLPIRFIPIGI